MSRVILPASVERRMRYERMMQTADPGYIGYWNRRLHEVKPGLALARAGENGSGPGIVPGCWHVRWRDPNPDNHAAPPPDSYFAVTTNGIGVPGGYREMGSDVIEFFRRADLWDQRVRADKERQRRLAEESAERAKLTAKEGRVSEIASNINALERPSAVFNTDLPWTNRAGARREKRAA